MTDSICSSDMDKYLWYLHHFWSILITSRRGEGAASHAHLWPYWRKRQGAFTSKRGLNAAIKPKLSKLRFIGEERLWIPGKPWSSQLQFPPSLSLLRLHRKWFCPAGSVAVSISHLLLDTKFSPSLLPNPRKMFSIAFPRNFPNHFSWVGLIPFYWLFVKCIFSAYDSYVYNFFLKLF